MLDFLKDKLNTLNFPALLSLIKDNNIELVDTKILGAIGIAGPERILLDQAKLNCYPPNMVYFAVLHEIYHYKRIKLLGKAAIVKQFSNTNFEEFHEHLIKEEVGADRYGRLLYFKFNRTQYPVQLTQQLHEEFYANRYKRLSKQVFGVVKNEEDYNKLFEEFIIK
jgi:hypothetical protein